MRQPKPKPSFVLSEHACLVHGDPFRLANCERVHGLPCPYCFDGTGIELGQTMTYFQITKLHVRGFEKREVEWAIEGARGCALAWSEVL